MEKIPRIIHYCWFGKGSMSKLAVKCIQSWEKNLPDYDIKLWNEDNFDLEKNKYVKEAYEAKKYAFVTDYVRLYALFNDGGIYMDTDVEVVKRLDVFLHYEAFIGFQTEEEIQTGLMASKPKKHWIKKLLIAYEDKKFINNNGNFDLTANVSLITKKLIDMGLNLGNEFQLMKNGVAVYPIEYFCAKDYRTGKIRKTKNTYTIHHFSGSWLSSREKIKSKVRKMIGEKLYNFAKTVIKK
ncbi:MAG: glycosyltransferase family 32 protein [Eubacteriaceae bacterium]